MPQTLLAWVIVAAALASGLGWASWLVARSPRDAGDGWLVPLLALALGSAGISLSGLWLGLVGLPLRWETILAVLVLLQTPGWVLAIRARTLPGSFARPSLPSLTPAHVPTLVAYVVLALVALAILFNGVYWPLSRDDACLYGQFGDSIAQTGLLPPLWADPVLQAGYPMHIQLTHAFAYSLAGWPNQYLAGLALTILSLAAVPAAYTLARLLFGAREALVAAVLLMLSEPFVQWASASYVDLPMAFFYTLAAVFAWRLWQRGNPWDALVAGLLIGLAAWTKNAGLVALLVLLAWVVWGLLWRRVTLAGAVVAMLAALAVAGPWYARNLVEAGIVLPATVWTDDVRHTLDTLFIHLRHQGFFRIAPLASLVGVFAAAGLLLWRRLRAPHLALLLLWVVPFHLAWWLFANYDPRFLLLYTPVLVVLGAWLLVRVYDRLPRSSRPAVLALVTGLVILGGAQAAWIGVEHKDEIMHQPLQGDLQKRTLVNEPYSPDRCNWDGSPLY
jgi:hypothetical protein